MTMPIEMRYRGVEIFLHEPGCTCGSEHDGRFDVADTKVTILTTLDEAENVRYYQVWYRTGKWNLHEAMDQLLERKRNGLGGHL